jgi:oxidase EvaA
VQRWDYVDGRIAHELGLFFDVVGVEVRAAGREVEQWHQPMIAPHGTGLAALLVREIDGVLHALMHARVAPGYLDVLELGPTVQCQPLTSDRLGEAVRPAFLDHVLAANGERIRFDAVHSEEGGRFLNARTRYVVVETDLEVAAEDYPDHRWMTLHQLSALMQHSHYLNVEARSLMACLHSLIAAPDRRERAHQ